MPFRVCVGGELRRYLPARDRQPCCNTGNPAAEKDPEMLLHKVAPDELRRTPEAEVLISDRALGANVVTDVVVIPDPLAIKPEDWRSDRCRDQGGQQQILRPRGSIRTGEYPPDETG